MIQDIFPHRLDNQYKPGRKAARDSRIVIYNDGKLLLKETEELVFPLGGELFPEGMPEECRYLLTLDEEDLFLVNVKDFNVPAGFSFVESRLLRQERKNPMHMLFAAVTAGHIHDWYRDNAFCGRCGHGMQHSDKERAMVCPCCGYTSYPRIMPAVIVGVRNGDMLLITKYRTGFRHNALIAGFTEIGETLEETVRREVMEEAGIRVKNIQYYKSQPWGVANDILTGFFCDVDGDDTIKMDEQELGYAQWTSRDDIILQPDNFSLTNEMMRLFRDGGI